MRLTFVLALCLLLVGSLSHGQDPDPAPTPAPEPDARHTGAPLGQMRLGPFIITPTIRVGSLAVDTNVDYGRNRKTDFLTSAGPGLDIALPFRDHWKLDVQGESQYFYFLRSKDLRRWIGSATAALLWATTGTRASISTSGGRDFSRPSFEVDKRVASRNINVTGRLERDLGRLTFGTTATFASTKVDRDQKFRGADLFTALSTERYDTSPQFRYRMTPFSSLIVEGSYALTRFPNAPARNFHSESAGIGVMTNGLFTGQITVGYRRNTLSSGRLGRSRPYVQANFPLPSSAQLGRRVRLYWSYSHLSTISAFSYDGALPTFERRSLMLGLAIMITKRMDLRLDGTQDKIKSDDEVLVTLDDGTQGKAIRDDVAYVGRADLGIRLGRARVALFTSYTTRKSLYFSDFGIEGLQAGARVEYSPR
jgi:hypothetical protein